MLTEQEIERDFYAHVSSSELAAEISGKVYRRDMRPADSKSEDIVVKAISADCGQVQRGAVSVNVYVPDITSSDGVSIPNLPRIAALQSLLLPDKLCAPTGYDITDSDLPSTERAEGTKQSFISAKIKFRIYSE